MGTSSPWALAAILTAILINICQAQNVPLPIKKEYHDLEKAIEISKLTLSKESTVYVDQNKNDGIQRVPKENAQIHKVSEALMKHNFQSTKESQKIKTHTGERNIEEKASHNPTFLHTHSKEFENKGKQAFDVLPLSIESHRGDNIQRRQQYNSHNDHSETLKDFDSFPSKRQTEWTIGQRPRAETNTFVQREPSYIDERDYYLPKDLIKSENRQETPVRNSDRFFNVDNWRESPTPKYDDFTESVTDNKKSFTKSDSIKNFQGNYENVYSEGSAYDSRSINERTPLVSNTEDVRFGRAGRRPLKDEEEKRPPTPKGNDQYHLPSDSIYCKEPEMWRPNYDPKETRHFNDKSSVRREPVYNKEVVPKDDRYPDTDYEENRPNGWDVQRPEEPPNYEETYDFKDDYSGSRDNSSRSTRENSSGYSGFPESYQPDINHHYSKPLQYDPVRVFPASPCHNVFKYEGREPEEDRWYANIYVSSDEVLNGIRLDITLDRPSELLTNWLADVKTKDSIHFTILSLNHKLVPGPPETVRIMVKFNGKKQVPYLKSINLNGRLICPSNRAQKTTTRRPVYENPGDLQLKRTTVRYVEPSKRPVGLNEYESNTKRTTAYVERHTTSSYEDERTSVPRSTSKFLQPNPNGYEETDQNTFVSAPSKKPHGRPAHSNGKPPPHAARPAQGNGPPGGQNQGYNKGQGQSQASNNKGGNKGQGLSTSGGNFKPNKQPNFSQDSQGEIECGKPSVQPSPLITHGQHTSRGQWPWHVALYKNVGTDLTFFCGGSLINTKYVLTAAHCVTKTYTTKPLDENTLVVYLGKYHLKLWSEGGVQNRQVSKIYVHSQYNSTDFRSDIAVLALSTPVEYSDYVRPICLWDSSNTRIEDVEGTMGTVVGWGFDENKMLTEELRQAKMPVVEQKTCLWSYPDFYPQFTSNMTYCAGFKNGTSVCNGDSGGGMVFPFKDRYGAEKWYLRGIVSISPARNDSRVCDTSHYVIFTDVAKYLPWLSNFI